LECGSTGYQDRSEGLPLFEAGNKQIATRNKRSLRGDAAANPAGRVMSCLAGQGAHRRAFKES